jgi:hypothetical protein
MAYTNAVMQLNHVVNSYHGKRTLMRDLSTSLASVKKVGDTIHLLTGYESVDVVQRDKMNKLYLLAKSKTIASAAKARAQFSGKINKRDMKKLRKTLTLKKKEEPSIYEYEPPKEVKELVQKAYERFS